MRHAFELRLDDFKAASAYSLWYLRHESWNLGLNLNVMIYRSSRDTPQTLLNIEASLRHQNSTFHDVTSSSIFSSHVDPAILSYATSELLHNHAMILPRSVLTKFNCMNLCCMLI